MNGSRLLKIASATLTVVALVALVAAAVASLGSWNTVAQETEVPVSQLRLLENGEFPTGQTQQASAEQEVTFVENWDYTRRGRPKPKTSGGGGGD